MLRKMGYEGGGLGRDGAGIEDPLATETRRPRDTQGVGIPQAARRAQLSWEAARRHVEQRERADFAQHNQRRFSDRACLKASRRARSACRDLDERNGLRWTPIWPSDEAHPQRSFADASGAVYAQPGTYLETGQNDGIGGLDEEAPEVALRTAVAYLRDCRGAASCTGARSTTPRRTSKAELAELASTTPSQLCYGWLSGMTVQGPMALSGTSGSSGGGAARGASSDSGRQRRRRRRAARAPPAGRQRRGAERRQRRWRRRRAAGGAALARRLLAARGDDARARRRPAVLDDDGALLRLGAGGLAQVLDRVLGLGALGLAHDECF